MLLEVYTGLITVENSVEVPTKDQHRLPFNIGNFTPKYVQSTYICTCVPNDMQKSIPRNLIHDAFKL